MERATVFRVTHNLEKNMDVTFTIETYDTAMATGGHGLAAQ